ncbi:MAG: methylenetetrahydrofolate--tRNA-(uracil(54)-C(5))-methyltransferase (FADH(2)-oxidizing) TrmFO [Halobacteriovoraceae bacterium]|nr:methylenetetrahydrofolate--tRNA-(uracil(54)-C(5))-methyltransferase (FADH(2)-oxidizing) TrmFO [Halobacteriovoraceae bacterium]MCB9095129.1 methylenetetrahydrofolate--tRNA-(uracil(54)-C(5))-methyltransferase (FADH(2)-oxidizing) TrmFO [Halobacteriovoraceae bacterium]
MSRSVVVVGAGLAGCDASFYLASRGIQVYLYESKRKTRNPAQKSNNLAELVCTNSLKSVDPGTGHGLLKTEMNKLGSLILEKAYLARVPAGDALAVDREKFSLLVTEELERHPLIEVIDEEVSDPMAILKKHNSDHLIISTGPLTLKSLEQWIVENICGDDLYFYDAIAPVVDADSLDYSKMYFKNRYGEVDGVDADYLNVPLDKEQYLDFVDDLKASEKVKPANFEEEKFFESCLPIDVMADRGVDTLRFSCMKPVGLETEELKPYAVIQLRKENLLGSAFNLVGFQNRLTYGEQKRIFQKLPGFSKASFVHLGSVHRNTFLNARKLLNRDLSSKKFPQMHFAGQIAGVEGYTESAAMGLYVASQIYQKICGRDVLSWPVESGIGALINYLMTAQKPIPSNINFGLLPKVELTREQRRSKKRKKLKKQLVAAKAELAFKEFEKFLDPKNGDSFICERP